MGVVSQLTDADRARIAARYPTAQGRRPLYLALVTVMTVLLGGWMVWAGLHGATKPVEADLTAFHDGGEHAIHADLRVQRRDPSQAAICTIKATAQEGARVGELDAEIPPGTEKITHQRVTVKTVNKAVSVNVEHCRLA
ncbi:hypothetical protein GCM10027030_16180 [Luteococcus sediminum]